MRRQVAAIFGAVLLACGATAVSCSDSNDDPIGRACRVIVRDCGVMHDMSACIDVVGDLPDDCVLCIGADNDCSYFSQCQRQLADCALPSDLKPSGSGDP